MFAACLRRVILCRNAHRKTEIVNRETWAKNWCVFKIEIFTYAAFSTVDYKCGIKLFII